MGLAICAWKRLTSSNTAPSPTLCATPTRSCRAFLARALCMGSLRMRIVSSKMPSIMVCTATMHSLSLLWFELIHFQTCSKSPRLFRPRSASKSEASLCLLSLAPMRPSLSSCALQCAFTFVAFTVAHPRALRAPKTLDQTSPSLTKGHSESAKLSGTLHILASLMYTARLSMAMFMGPLV
eukprot:3579275-Alexandrium_andersonii.AAC.1